MILRAVSGFADAYRKSLAYTEDFERWLKSSGFFDRLTEKQRAVYQVAKSGVAEEFTASNVREHLGCGYSTAVSTLSGLVELQIFEKRKMGREWVFFLRAPSATGSQNGSESPRFRAISA